MNTTVSNGPWQGTDGKREQVAKHDVLLLNRYFDDRAVWDEAAIDERTTALTDLLLKIWPVPEGHTGVISDPQPKENSWVEIRHLVAAGLLPPGSVLRPRPGQWESVEAVVTSDGQIEIDGKKYSSPSNAGYHVKGGKATNGWSFWQLLDGRRLSDIRTLYRGENAEKPAGFDWSRLHQILEALPAGSWTSYSELADAIGTAPQPLGAHIMRCAQCTHVWRVLTSEGRVAPGFAWTDTDDKGDADELLRAEGVGVVEGVADRAQKLDSDALTALLADDE